MPDSHIAKVIISEYTQIIINHHNEITKPIIVSKLNYNLIHSYITQVIINNYIQMIVPILNLKLNYN